MLVDSHCHLDFPELRADFEGVLERMRANGVTHALTPAPHRPATAPGTACAT